jgi:hypothetical protein
MALGYKNCIKRLRKNGYKVELSDRRLIKTLLNEGLTIDQVVTKMLAESTLDVIETVQQIEALGADVETGRGQLAEIKDFRTEQLKAEMASRREISQKISEANAEYQDIKQDAEMFDKILSQALDEEVAFLDLTENEAKLYFGQLMMRATTTELPTGKPGQNRNRIWPEDRFRVAMENGTLLVSGNTPQEIYDSRVALETQLAEKKKVVQELKAQKAEVQKQIESKFGPETVVEPDVLFQKEGDLEAEVTGVAAKGDVNKQRMTRLLGAQLYGDMNKIQSVTVKEVFQNAFDAVRTAVRNGDIEDGQITMEVTEDKRTLIVQDNGVGMTPEMINEGFLTLAGTRKEGDVNSGGFGVAKGLFLAGNKKLKLVTIRDGVKTTLETTGDDFMASLEDPEHSLDQRYPADQALRVSKTDGENGTRVEITIPEQFQDFKTREFKDIRQFEGWDMGSTADNQLLDPRITVRTRVRPDTRFNTRDAGKEFRLDRYRSIGEVRFEWGTADILIEKDENEHVSSKNTTISIEGLNQLDIMTTENPWDPGAGKLKRRIYINMHPQDADGNPIDAGDPGYPMELNRQGLQQHAAEDIFQIQSYLAVLMWRDQSAEIARGYGTLREIKPSGELGDPVDLTPPPPVQESLTGKIDTGEELRVENGELIVDGVGQGKLDRDNMAQERREMDEYKVDQDLVPTQRPMIHNQMAFKAEEEMTSYFLDDTAAEPGMDLIEALNQEFGENRVNEYFFSVGDVFMDIRDLLANYGQEKMYEDIEKIGVGVSVLGRRYYGVHTKVPGRMMFVNPGQDPREINDIREMDWDGPKARDDMDSKEFQTVATSMITTMVHEAAHYAEMSHDQDYLFALQSAFSTMLEHSEHVDHIKDRLQEAIYENWEIYRYISEALESGSIEVSGISLSDVGSDSRGNESRADVAARERRERGRGEGGPDEAAQGDVDTGQQQDADAIQAGYRDGGTVVPEGDVHPNAGEDSEFYQTYWHGSHAKWDFPDLGFMGTGEGAQMAGYGMYLAEVMDVGKGYQPRDLKRDQNLYDMYKQAEQANDAIRMELLEDAMLHWTPDEIRENYTEDNGYGPEAVARAQEFADELHAIDQESEGSLYQIEINDEADAMMMLWDAPLSEQPEAVQAALKSLIQRTASAFPDGILAEMGFEEIGTGGALYRALADDLGSEKEASMELNSVGIPGHKFLDAQSRVSPVSAGTGGFIQGIRDVLGRQPTHNLVLYDTSVIDQVKRDGEVVYPEQALEQGGIEEGGERGRITFNEARKGFIEILSSGDVSTFIHETGHLYLEVLRWAAQQENAPQQLKDDWQTVKEYTGATDEAIPKDAHEKFANSFEIYALEGKAPSIALQDSFSFFRSWMTRIYRKLKNITGVHLHPEIRGVMDRLLASDEEIAIAEQSQGYVALFATAQDADMTEAEFELYAKQVQREHDDNVGKEHRRMMAAMERDQTKWWKAERKKIRAEVEEEMHEERVYKALYFLQRGTRPDGSPTRGQATKINKESLLRLLNYDQQSLNKLPRPFIYTVEGGTDVEVLARTLEYANGLEMIEEISNAKRMKDVINAETEVRMRRIYGDPLTDGTLPDNALRRVHTEGRLKILTKELRKLRQLAAEDRPAVRAAQQAERQRDRQAREANKGQIPGRAEMAMLKAAAREVINGMRISQIKPHIYLRGEQKAGREAFAALEKRDYQTAYAAKLRQIKNHEMYRAAMAVQKEMESTRKAVIRYQGPRLRKKLGLAKVLNQVDAVLENVDLKKRSMADLERKKALQGLKEAVSKGTLIVTPDTQRKIMDESVHWTEFTPDEFREIKSVLKQIEHGALNEDKMTVNGELVDYQEVEDEIVDHMRTANEEIKLRPGGVQTSGERGNSNVDQSIMTWLRPSSIARILDKTGFGALTRRIIVPLRRAYAEKLIPMLHQAQKDVMQIYLKHYNMTELGQMSKRHYKINTLGGELYSKSELLSMALNWGNQGNRDAVLGGSYKGKPVFTEQTVREMLSHLTSKDWAFVQDIWDYNDTYREAIFDAEERRRGIRPEKVEALPFSIRTSDGQLITVKGGYHPLRYDHQYDAKEGRGKQKVKAEEAIDNALNHIANGTFVTANTRAGSTHNRVKNHGRVVRLGLNIIDSHLREVIRDIAIGDEVRHVKRLLDSGSVERAFRDTGNGAAYEALGLWLTDAAVGELPAENAIEFGIAWLRTGFTKAKLGWNFAVMALQLTGLFQTISVIGTRAFSAGFVKYIQNPAAATRHVMDQSSFLHTRYVVGGFDKDVQDTKAIVESEFGSMPTRTKRAYNFVANTLFTGIAWFQKIVDVITWMGAYEKGLNEINQDAGGLSEQDAIIYADTQVEAAQTSGFFSDRSGLERGTTGLRKNRQSQLLRIWTTLISYMLAKSNIAYEKYKDTNFKDPKQVMDLLLDMILLYTVEGIASALIYQRLPEDDDEPEEWAKWAAVQSLDSLTAGIPFVREIASARFGGGNTPVGVFSNDAMTLIEQYLQGEADWASVDATLDVVGTIGHLPTGQISKTGEKLWEEGLTTDDWWEYFTGPKD